jgi:GT2 family glycosyltransferase
VTVVIPHRDGTDILRHALIHLQKTRYPNFEIVVSSGGSTDGSLDRVRAEFPDVRVIASSANWGFAAACNAGIRGSTGPYVALLNNDTETDPGWLSRLVETAETDPGIAAVGAKVLQFTRRDRFDYAGAAGGELDLFGYPYAWGRVFDTLETDTGQYDSTRDVFWASGAALLLRRSALDRIGLLDETFFAHMEEIDLQWRLLRAGYRVVCQPSAVVYHRGGGTLDSAALRKMVLNHRNSLAMLMKNHSCETLAWVLPFRLCLEALTIGASIARGEIRRAAAVVLGLSGAVRRLPSILLGRRKAQAGAVLSESRFLHRMHRGSAALAYYTFHKRTAARIRTGNP